MWREELDLHPAAEGYDNVLFHGWQITFFRNKGAHIIGSVRLIGTCNVSDTSSAVLSPCVESADAVPGHDSDPGNQVGQTDEFRMQFTTSRDSLALRFTKEE